METDDFVRGVSTWQFGCTLPEDAFKPDWVEILPDKIVEKIEQHHTRCDGDGLTGPWCDDCYFGVSQFIEEEEWLDLP